MLEQLGYSSKHGCLLEFGITLEPFDVWNVCSDIQIIMNPMLWIILISKGTAQDYQDLFNTFPVEAIAYDEATIVYLEMNTCEHQPAQVVVTVQTHLPLVCRLNASLMSSHGAWM